jgi:hypothetical protein
MRTSKEKKRISNFHALGLCFLFLSLPAAARTVIQQNFPGTHWKDLTQPAVVMNDDGEIYPTFPGGRGRDLTAPNYYQNGDTYYQEALPGIKARDYSEPSFTIQNEDDM